MKKPSLPLVVLVLAFFLGMGTASAYDFSAVCPSGQTLYYNIIDASNHHVAITYPGSSFSAPYPSQQPTGNLTLPSSVTYNGVAYSVTAIDHYAFYGCSGLTGSLSIPNTVVEISHLAFQNCSGFTGTLTLNDGLTTLGSSVFTGCGFSGSLVIPNSVTVIGDWAFQGCSGFTGTLVIGNSVTTIGASAFSDCSGFTGSLTIPNSVTELGISAFKGCSGFNGTLTISNSLSEIGYSTFYGCTGFTGSLAIPNTVTTIGSHAFHDCRGFTGSLNLSNSLTTIENDAFYNCRGFTGSLTLPDALTSIGSYAFGDCSAFTGTLTIPNALTSIGSYAFKGLSHLTNMMVYAETPPTLGNGAFNYIPSGIPVYVPCNSLASYEAAEGWDYFTNKQCFPSTVTLSSFPADGGTVTGGGTFEHEASCTVTAVPSTGYPYYQFLHWSKDGMVVSCDVEYTFAVTEDVHLEAVFMATANNGNLLGEGYEATTDLPSHSYYNYAISQQIYTVSELSSWSRTISNISFFNAGWEETRNYDIYLAHTNKNYFMSNQDWITVSASDKVFSGNVTLKQGVWTTIVFDTPFDYNGSSNLVLVMDDNTGDYTYSPHMKCRVYDTDNNQALYVYADGTDFAPGNPPYNSGSMKMKKNQIILNRQLYNINASSSNTSFGTVSGSGQYGINDVCRLKATPRPGYIFMDWTDNTGTVVSTSATYSFVVEDNKTLTATFLPEGDYCDLTFDLQDSYGDGWNGSYLQVSLDNGLTRIFTIPALGMNIAYTLPIENGSHVELSWHPVAYPEECSFEVRYANGNLLCTSFSHDVFNEFEYDFDMNCEEMPATWVYIGDGGTASDVSLPSHSYYRYSISEQIYTADEIGRAGSINSIAFYNQTSMSRIRTYDIYLKLTDKTQFNTSSDAVNVVEADKVFSGSVEMASNQWTIITFDTPFEYDGSANLVVVVDDNTGEYATAPYMACRVFSTSGTQAIRNYSDDMNYNPAQSSNYFYSFLGVKNQVYFGFTQEPSTVTQTLNLASGWNWVSFNVEVTMDDVKAAVVAANPGAAPVIKSKGNGQTSYNGAVWVGALKTLDLSQMYEIKVANACTVTLEGIPVNSADHPATIKNGVNWIAYPLNETMSVATAFAGFPVTGDNVKSKDSGQATWNGVMWLGALKNLVPGTGYLYISKASGDKTLTF